MRLCAKKWLVHQFQPSRETGENFQNLRQTQRVGSGRKMSWGQGNNLILYPPPPPHTHTNAKSGILLTDALRSRWFFFIIPYVNFPYKASIDEWLIFETITRCFSDYEYRHSFAIAASDSLKYQYGHMMRNANAYTVHSHQEMFNNNGRQEAWFDHFQLPITSFMVRNIKCGYLFS